jgi:ABC-type multidrug transport system fused ATPase/permease subunit
MQHLRQSVKGQPPTSIAVTHHLESLKHVDTICVLSGGRIVERGSFDDLSKAGSAFAMLRVLQQTRNTNINDLASAVASSAC